MIASLHHMLELISTCTGLYRGNGATFNLPCIGIKVLSVEREQKLVVL
jgi:hypothetical protein